MPKKNCGHLVAAVAAMALSLPATGYAQASSYQNHDDLSRELRVLADGSDVLELRSIGESNEGREIWMLEVGDPGAGDMEDRPAVLVVANLEGDHLYGGELAIEMARYLSANAASPEVRQVLADRAVYLIPRLNPDGAEMMFGEIKRAHLRNTRPQDDDNDGRIDEDAPEDLNGDGMITIMRARDAAGEYMIDAAEPRLMKAADPAAGERGEYRLYWEGTDQDGDGFINEDGRGGIDLNRNFQHAYPYWEADAGPHMVSEPASRALMDFVIANGNIGAILTFGHSDNLVTPPNSQGELADPVVLALTEFADAPLNEIYEAGMFENVESFEYEGQRFRGTQPGRDNEPDSGRRPAESVNSDDLKYFNTVSEAYRELTGIERVPINREAEGAFFQYGYFQYGVPSFSTVGWGVPELEGEIEGDAAILAALEAAGAAPFVPWTSYEHPTLGQVEIGGFEPGSTVNPPAATVAQMGSAHGQFLVRLAGMLPQISIAETEVTAHGGGIYTVEAVIENSGYFPTALAHGVVAESVDPTTVQIGVPPVDVISGDDKTSRVETLAGSGNRKNFLWVVRGQPGQQVEIRARAEKGGTATTTVRLQ